MNESVIRGLAIGIAATVGVLIFGPAVAQTARPIVRRAVKSTVQAYVRGQEAVAELMELAEDAYAEAWTELKEEADLKTGPAQSEPNVEPDSASKESRVGRKKRAR